MEPESRQPLTPLEESLLEEGYRFDFFQAVRLLEGRAEARAPVGEDSDPGRETIRFAADLRLSFVPSDVSDVDVPDDPELPVRMEVPFFGVANPASFGSLPICYAEHVRNREMVKDHALRDFLDIFNHRLTSLFYRAWKKHRFDVEYEATAPDEGAKFEQALYSLVGLGTAGLRRRLSFSDLGLLRWAGALQRRPVPEQILRDLLAETFGTQVEIESFVPQWYDLEPDELMPLGRTEARLGEDVMLGRTVQAAQSRFRIRLGPLGRDDYEELLPGGAAWEVLNDLVRFAVGPEFDFEVQLVLRADEAPQMRLGGQEAARLGWTSWVSVRPLTEDPDQVVLESGRATPSARHAA